MKNSKHVVPLLVPMLVVFLSLGAISLQLYWTPIVKIWHHHISTPRNNHLCKASVPLIETEQQLKPLLRQRRKQLDAYISTRKTFFATYGNDRYIKTRARIANEAKISKYFDEVRVFTPDHLPTSFRRHFRDVLPRGRGGGYWVWKYIVVRRMMKRMNWGDFLVYMDADCTVNPSARGRFDEYRLLANVSRTGILSISYGDPERWWTTDRLFEEMGLRNKESFELSNHLISGILLFQKTKEVMNMLRMWKSVIYSDPLISTDDYNAQTTRRDFREHRHDQSILSLVRKCVGTVAIPIVEFREKEIAPLQISAIKG